MSRVLKSLFLVLFFGLSCNAIAQQTSNEGSGGMKNACEVSGGTFTGSEGGNWACCWSDWGCYGCVDSHCKIKCHNDRCRKANGVSRSVSNASPVSGLAPTGMKAPIAPIKENKEMSPSKPASVSKTQQE